MNIAETGATKSNTKLFVGVIVVVIVVFAVWKYYQPTTTASVYQTQPSQPKAYDPTQVVQTPTATPPAYNPTQPVVQVPTPPTIQGVWNLFDGDTQIDPANITFTLTSSDHGTYTWGSDTGALVRTSDSPEMWTVENVLTKAQFIPPDTIRVTNYGNWNFRRHK